MRLEAAEAAYTEAKLRALGADDDNSRGVETARLGRSVLFSIQSRRSNPSVNRVIGFSTEDLEHLDEILDWLRNRSDCFWFDVAPALVDGTVLKALADAGLYVSFFLNVVCVPPHKTQVSTPMSVTVQEIDLLVRAHDFGVVFSKGFGVPMKLIESTERSMSIEYSASGWHTYLATIDGEPASVAAMYVERAQITSIDAMATVPDYRRRGCQSALLGRCIADAARAGCTLVVSQTEPSSGSERNMVRAGFQIAYTKLLYAPRKAGSGP